MNETIEYFNEIQNYVTDFKELFSESLKINSKIISSLSHIELERSLITVNNINPNTLSHFKRKKNYLNKELNNCYINAVYENNKKYAEQCKKSLEQLIYIEQDLEKIIELYKLLPELIIEKNKRNFSLIGAKK